MKKQIREWERPETYLNECTVISSPDEEGEGGGVPAVPRIIKDDFIVLRFQLLILV